MSGYGPRVNGGSPGGSGARRRVGGRVERLDLDSTLGLAPVCRRHARSMLASCASPLSRCPPSCSWARRAATAITSTTAGRSSGPSPRSLSLVTVGAMANELGLRGVAFEVDDLQAEVDRLAGEGYGLVGGVGRYENAWLMAYVRGPGGIIVALAERLGSAAEPPLGCQS